MARSVLAIDPATVTGWALVRRADSGREELVTHGVLDMRCPTPAPAVSIHRICADAGVLSRSDPNTPTLVIEQPMSEHPQALKVIERIVGRWQQVAETLWFHHDPDLHLVRPNVWQAAILKGLYRGGSGSRKAREAARASRKAAAVQYVGIAFQKGVSEDEADAICLASYALRCL